MAFNTNLDIGGMIGSIGGQAGSVNGLMNKLMDPEILNDPAKMIQTSMELMRAQQKLTTMSEGFTKSMKAATDAAKAAITNMH